MPIIAAILRALLAALLIIGAPAGAQTLQDVLSIHQKEVERASRKTIDPVIADLIASGLPQVPEFIEKWQDKNVWMLKDDKTFFYVEEGDDKAYTLIDIDTGEAVATVDKKDIKQLKPNSGVRSVMAVALVQFQLSDPDPARRAAALQAIERDPEASQLKPLQNSIEGEQDAALKSRKQTLARLLSARFAEEPSERIEAIRQLSGSLSVETRAALNPILTTRIVIEDELDENANIAEELVPGGPELSVEDAYQMLVRAEAAPEFPDADARRELLIENIEEQQVAGVPVAELNTQEARDAAYVALTKVADVPDWSPELTAETLVAEHRFFSVYQEPDAEVTSAARETLDEIENRVGLYQTADLLLDGISLASIYFLAAIGLAITFGVMRVINMAHGEFIMMGAYTGYVVQLFITDYTISLIVALPLAFAVTFAAGVAMERLVIRHLYKRPLETLLATFGISIALQQLAKNIFGTQARPLTAPGWLDGAWVMNDVVSISYIRIAIFVLGVAFLLLLLFILNRTRLGLEVRAVTQNPKMAASMGINPARINMLTFGLGSGIAGIAGVAIGLYAKFTSEL